MFLFFVFVYIYIYMEGWGVRESSRKYMEEVKVVLNKYKSKRN